MQVRTSLADEPPLPSPVITDPEPVTPAATTLLLNEPMLTVAAPGAATEVRGWLSSICAQVD